MNNEINNSRRQLTLFITHQNETIEHIRARFNPVQYHLISAHVTLCREDEIKRIEKVIENLRSISLHQPVRIAFDPPERFANGKGLLMPAKTINPEFDDLRKAVLKGISEPPAFHLPHITLMHRAIPPVLIQSLM